MKRFILLIVSIFVSMLAFSVVASAQSYYSDGILFVIKDNTAFISIPEGHNPTRFCDTVAVCKITPEGESFFRIDSESPYAIVRKSMHCEEGVFKKGSPDSLYISFRLPAKYMELMIDFDVDSDLYLPNAKRHVLEYPKEKSIVLPKRRRILFGISPSAGFGSLALFNILNIPGLFPVFPIELRNSVNNSIVVTIPCMTDGFFEQAEIKGEYVKIIENGLVWRGHTFQLEPEGSQTNHFLHPFIKALSDLGN